MLESLKEIGFSDNEIKVYESLLKEGEQTILEISKNSKINRSYSYEVLESLFKKGLITKSIKDNRIYWKSLPKEKIFIYIDDLKKDISSSIRKIKENSKVSKREIKIYSGKKGIQRVCENIAESKTKVIGFGAEGQLKKFFPYSYMHIFNKIKKNKIRFELITLKDKIPLVKGMTRFKSFKKEFPSCVEINIYEDKTVIFFWKEDLEAIEIKDIDVANSFRNYHKEFWSLE
jgi:sugar-specific transcriptional regulator TrmB